MTEFKRRDKTPLIEGDVWSNDAFGTLQGYADFLTNALTANHENFVLNVNGSWGTGKSFFVNRWAEDLRKRNFPVVEFNAWENDSEADPLTPILAACTESLREHFTDDQTLIEDIKNKGGRIALKVGGIAAKAGLRKLLGDDGAKDLCNIFSEETEKDLIKLGGTLVDEQVKKQLERKSFIDELGALVAKLEEYGKLPIFIFIDELDRCRPTFAIELLERVKHLFSVDGIKFIISTDTKQLVHSIKGVYGHEFDATTYLQRFFDETFTLPQPDEQQFAELLFRNDDPTQAWMNQWIVLESPATTFSELSKGFELSLRQQLQAYHRVSAVIANISASAENPLHFILVCTLVIFRLRYPDHYSKVLTSSDKKSAWMEAVREKRIRIGGNMLVSFYYSLMDKEHRFIATDITSLRDDVGRKAASASDMDRLKLKILNAINQNYQSFSRYPQLVELTDYIDTPS